MHMHMKCTYIHDRRQFRVSETPTTNCWSVHCFSRHVASWTFSAIPKDREKERRKSRTLTRSPNTSVFRSNFTELYAIRWHYHIIQRWHADQNRRGLSSVRRKCFGVIECRGGKYQFCGFFGVLLSSCLKFIKVERKSSWDDDSEWHVYQFLQSSHRLLLVVVIHIRWDFKEDPNETSSYFVHFLSDLGQGIEDVRRSFEK